MSLHNKPQDRSKLLRRNYGEPIYAALPEDLAWFKHLASLGKLGNYDRNCGCPGCRGVRERWEGMGKSFCIQRSGGAD